MKRATETIVLLALLAAVGGLIYTAWQWREGSRSDGCQVCRRHLHAGSQVVALQQERKEAFCCPTCAVTFGRQAEQAVRVVELTDFESGSRISPTEAYLVQGSDVNLCLQHPVLTDSQKQPASMQFDRCSPSVLAFSSRQAAEAFRQEHGGRLLPFSALPLH
jgi:hypothetical protein